MSLRAQNKMYYNDIQELQAQLSRADKAYAELEIEKDRAIAQGQIEK